MFSVFFNKFFKNEKERCRKSEDSQRRSLTGASHGNQTMDTAFSIGGSVCHWICDDSSLRKLRLQFLVPFTVFVHTVCST